MHVFSKFEIISFSIIYYNNIVIWVVKLFRVQFMINYDDFQHVNFVFSQIFILLFWGLFDDETDLRGTGRLEVN
jgi:hypothetical protein